MLSMPQGVHHRCSYGMHKKPISSPFGYKNECVTRASGHRVRVQIFGSGDDPCMSTVEMVIT